MAVVKTKPLNLEMSHLSMDLANIPVEESCLFLNSLREDKDTEKTESEKDENDPKGGMSSVGSMDQLELWVGLLSTWCSQKPLWQLTN